MQSSRHIISWGANLWKFPLSSFHSMCIWQYECPLQFQSQLYKLEWLWSEWLKYTNHIHVYTPRIIPVGSIHCKTTIRSRNGHLTKVISSAAETMIMMKEYFLQFSNFAVSLLPYSFLLLLDVRMLTIPGSNVRYCTSATLKCSILSSHVNTVFKQVSHL